MAAENMACGNAAARGRNTATAVTRNRDLDGIAPSAAARSTGGGTATIDRRGRVVAGTAWALVTGAGTGIGRCYALRLAALGYHVIIAGLRRAPLEAVRQEILTAAGVHPDDPTGVQPPVASQSPAGPARNTGAHTPDGPIGTQNPAGVQATSTAPDPDSPAVAEAPGAPTVTPEPAEAQYPTGPAEVHNPAGSSATPRRPDVRILEIDLARAEASDELYAAVRGMDIEIDVLINNAGIFSFRDILVTPAERIERMILLHDMTLSKNCLAFGRDMAARGRGWILNMSSYSIWMPFPGMALYTATKAYVRAFSVAFAKEVRERGVRVTAVCPAGVATDLYGLTPRWQRIGRRLGVLISADSCARRCLNALWRGRRTIVPDWWNRLFIPLCKAMPMWMLRPLRHFTMKFQK